MYILSRDVADFTFPNLAGAKSSRVCELKSSWSRNRSRIWKFCST